MSNWNTLVFTNRREPEGVFYINDKNTYSQEVYLKNTKDMNVMVLIDEILLKYPQTDKYIDFIIEQDEQLSEYKYELKNIDESGWTVINIDTDFSKFQNGKANLRIKSENINEDYIGLFLTSGLQKYDIQPVKINNIQKENMYISLSYNISNNKLGLSKSIVFYLYIVVLELLCIYLYRMYKKFPITVISFIIILFSVFKYNTININEIDGWIRTTWIMDYKFGFLNRGFLGTILSFISNKTISDNILIIIFRIFTILLIFISIFWINYIEKNTKECIEIKNNLYLWIFSPLFITYFLSGKTLFGRIDIILLIIFFLSLLIITKKNNHYVNLLLPILFLIGVLVYHEFTILIFPMLILIMYLHYLNSNIFDKEYFLYILIASVIVTVMTTIYLVFNNALLKDEIMPSQFYAWMKSKVDMPIDFTQSITYAYGGRNQKMMDTLDIFRHHLRFRFFLMNVCLSPIYIYISKQYIRIINNKESIKEKMVYIMLLLSPMLLVLTLNGTDYLRYICVFFTVYINSFLSALLIDEKASIILKKSNEGYSGLEKIFHMMFILIICGFATNSCWPFMDIDNNIIIFFDNIVNNLN
jgi:membrane protein